MKNFVVIWVGIVVVLVGCEESPEPDLRSENEIYNEMKRPLDEAWKHVEGRKRMDEEKANQFVSALAQSVSKNRSAENGPKAIDRLKSQCVGYAKRAERQALWHGVALFARIHQMLEPGSVKLKRLAEHAALELSKPIVDVTGFAGVPGDPNIFVHVYLPLEGVMLGVKIVREGEEFLNPPYTLRVVEIIGKFRGVTFEYMASGDRFDVMLGEKRIQAFLAPPAPDREQAGAPSRSGGGSSGGSSSARSGPLKRSRPEDD